MEKTKILSIIGPTATGKTSLAINLAKQFGGEIISGDSIQIYKEFNILSAKPTKEELSEVKHHLVDFLSVNEIYSVAKFKEMASDCIIDIKSRNKLPILVGGTGLYIDSLIKNIDFSAPSPGEGKNISLPDSGEELMEMLKKVDPESAASIHVNNIKRLKRALEFYYTVGYPISKQVSDSKKIESPYEACKIGLNFRNREILYSKINKRVDEMAKNGLLEEAEKVYAQNEVSKTAQAAIGYKEMVDYLEGRETLEGAYENVKKFSRRYAKRQITWFKRDENINWIYIDDYNDFSQVVKKAKEITEKFIQ